MTSYTVTELLQKGRVTEYKEALGLLALPPKTSSRILGAFWTCDFGAQFKAEFGLNVGDAHTEEAHPGSVDPEVDAIIAGSGVSPGARYAPVAYSLGFEADRPAHTIRLADGWLTQWRWRKCPVCHGIDVCPGGRLFWDADLPVGIEPSLEEVAAWAASLRSLIAPFGWRPATSIELIHYAIATIADQHDHWTLALGDSCALCQRACRSAYSVRESLFTLMHCSDQERRDGCLDGPASFLLVAKRYGEFYDGALIDAV